MEKLMKQFPVYNDVSQDIQLRHPHLTAAIPQHQLEPPSEKPRFPMIVYNMLEGVGCDDLDVSEIISFQPHGRSFKIRDRDRFISEMLPRFFPKQSTISSFQRQLSIYGFLRLVKEGPDQNSYYHEMFLRGRPDLLDLMKRQIKKGNMVRHLYDPSTEPCFYSMSPIQNVLPQQQQHNTTDAANQITASNPTVEFHQDSTDSKPLFYCRKSMQSFDDNHSILSNPMVSEVATQNDAFNTTSNLATSLYTFPTSNTPIPHGSQSSNTSCTGTRLFTIESSNSETTSNTMMAFNPAEATSATTATGLPVRPISELGLPAVSIVQNQQINPLWMTGDNINMNSMNQLSIALLSSSQTRAYIPQLQTAMQQHNETLSEYYKLRNHLIGNHPSATTHLNNATDFEPYDHRTRTQEEHQRQAQIESASSPRNVPIQGYLDPSLHVVGNAMIGRNDNTNAHTTDGYSNSRNDGCCHDTNAGDTLVWGNTDVHDDGSISDESLNRDWGLQK